MLFIKTFLSWIRNSRGHLHIHSVLTLDLVRLENEFQFSQWNWKFCYYNSRLKGFISDVQILDIQYDPWIAAPNIHVHQYKYISLQFFFPWRNGPSGPAPPHYQGFTITLRHTTIGSIPLNEWSTRSRDLYLTIHNTHKRQTSMPPAWFEPTIPASERPQTYALESAATGIGFLDS